jgi:response regulator RpfG family c-di-GMP phosphodiesterase
MSQGLSIMLIDDSIVDLFLHERFITLKSIARQISKFDYAGNAIKYLNDSDEAGWPDVILLDIQMPLMDGFDFLNKYEGLPEKYRQNCHIIMVSSSLDYGDISKARANSQVLELLKKPLNIDELISLLNEHKIK